jgi:hypothetical protein
MAVEVVFSRVVVLGGTALWACEVCFFLAVLLEAFPLFHLHELVWGHVQRFPPVALVVAVQN